MTSHHKYLFILLSFIFSWRSLNAQVFSPNYTACPNQTVMVSLTWNNVSNITATINPGNIIISSPNLTCVISATATTVYSVSAVGSSLNLPTNSNTTFILFVQPPPAMVISNQIDYCHLSNATFICPIGGVSYSVSGPPGVANIVSPSNVITIPNITAVPYTGNYTVTSVIAGCTTTGLTSINVAPNYQITVNTPSNVCLGGSANLTAAMPTATSFVWTGPNSYNSPPQSTNIICNSLSQQGVYTVYSDIIYNTVTCARSATTQINIVQTSPVVASASPSKTLCEGSSLNLSAGVTNGQPQGYTWQGPQGYNSSLQNPVLTSVLPNMAGVYNVVALFFNSSITCTTGAAVTVSIIATVQPSVVSTPNVCQNGSATLSAGAAGAVSYSWTGPNNFSSSLPNQVLYNMQPNQSGTYFVYTKFSGGTSVLCTTSKSVQINVVPINSISVIPPGQVCQPNNAYLQANAIGANNYVWYGPNGYGPIPTANAVVYYPTPTASGIYTVTAYFINGVTCSNTNTVSLTVNPLLNFTLVPYQILCYNKPVTINGPAGATSYTWTSSNGYYSNTQNVNIPSAQPSQSGTYTLNVSLGPCVTSGTSQIHVLTPIQFTLTPHDRTICRGDTVLLEAGATGGSENYAYEWNPAVYLASNNGSFQSGIPLGTTVYNLIVHDDICPEYKISHSFTIDVKQPPQPDLQLAKTEGCAPLVQLYNSKTQATSTLTTYDFGGLMQVQGDSIYYSLKSPGTYTLKVISLGTNGCTGIYTYPFPITVYPKPGTQVTWEPESPTVTDMISFNPTNNVEPNSYTWLLSNQVRSGYDTSVYKNPQVQYEIAGSYPVILITKTENGCIDTVSKLVEVRDNFNVFIPNTFTPNGDGLNEFFQVKGSGFKADGFVMEITNRWGNLIYSTNDATKGWDGTENGVKAGDGVYIYKIKLVGSNGEGRKEYTGYVTLYK